MEVAEQNRERTIGALREQAAQAAPRYKPTISEESQRLVASRPGGSVVDRMASEETKRKERLEEALKRAELEKVDSTVALTEEAIQSVVERLGSDQQRRETAAEQLAARRQLEEETQVAEMFAPKMSPASRKMAESSAAGGGSQKERLERLTQQPIREGVETLYISHQQLEQQRRAASGKRLSVATVEFVKRNDDAIEKRNANLEAKKLQILEERQRQTADAGGKPEWDGRYIPEQRSSKLPSKSSLDHRLHRSGVLDRDALPEAVPPPRSVAKIKKADADAAAQRLYESAKASQAKKAEKRRQYEEQTAKPYKPTLPVRLHFHFLCFFHDLPGTFCDFSGTLSCCL